MSIYDTDHLGLGQGYGGPATGFWDNAKAAYDQQYRVDSLAALEAEVSDEWAKSLQEYERVTGEAPGLSLAYAPMGTYISAVMGEETPWYTKDVNDSQTRARALEINQKIKDLGNPNIKSLDQVIQDVIKLRQQVSGTSGDVANRQTIAGWLGGFAGGVAGSFTTRDPLQLISLGFGGFGKTFAARMATEMGIAGATETAQQFLGVEPTRQLLGEDEGSPWTNVLYAAAGAGIIRGIGEGIGTGAKFLTERVRDGAEEVPLDFTDSQLRSMFERVDTPTARAGEHALDAQIHFDRLNPYTDTDSGMRRFIGELSEVQDLMAGKADTAIRLIPTEQLPIELDDLSFEMHQVKEAQPEVFNKLTEAQTRLDDINTQLAETEIQLSRVDQVEGLSRIDPDTAELARSYQADLDSPNASAVKKEQARRALDQIAETIGPERIAKETSNAAIQPRKDLQRLRQQRKAAMREFKKARDEVDKAIAYNQQKARLAELTQQKKDVGALGLYAKANDEPYVGPLLQHEAVEAAVGAAEEAQKQIPRAANAITETPEGMIDIGEGYEIPSDFTLEVDDGAGGTRTMSAKEIFDELAEDDKLVQAMGQCAL